MMCRPLPPALRQYGLGIVALTLLAFAIVLVRGHLLHQSYPYNHLLMPPGHLFADFGCYGPRFRSFGTAAFFNAPGHPFTYPAPIALLYRFYYRLPGSLYMFLGTIMAAALGSAAVFADALRKRGIAPAAAIGFSLTALLCSYPLWFVVESSNMEAILWIVLALGLLAYVGGRYRWAAALFGIAAAMKLFPVLFLALFFRRRQYRFFGLGLLVAGAVSLVSLWGMGPTLAVAARGIAKGLREFTGFYVLQARWPETGFDHSLFSLVKQFGLIFRRFHYGEISPAFLVHAYPVYLGVCGVGAVALFFARLRRLPPLNAVLAFVVLALLLPPVSHDYTLVQLYVPWGLLVLFVIDRFHETGRLERGTGTMLLLLAVLLTPQSYLFCPFSDFRIMGCGGQVKALSLVLLLVQTIRYPLTEVSREMRVAGHERSS